MGGSTDALQEVKTGAVAGMEYISACYKEAVSRYYPLAAGLAGKIAGFILTAPAADSGYFDAVP
ncbi:MAG TPA: hypothetical protein PK728_08625 [Bacillota bacterium]|nr:hypothetical protein [Bacillota bacterium]